MKFWMSLLCVMALLPSVWAGPKNQDYLEEYLYNDFKSSLLSGDASSLRSGFLPEEQSLFVDALWDVVEEENPGGLRVLDEVNTFHFDLIERLRIGILKIKFKRSQKLDDDLVQELVNVLLAPEAETRLIYILASYEEELLTAGHSDVIDLAKKHEAYLDIAQVEESSREVPDDVVADLFYNSPDVSAYMNGEYVKSVKIFMFCRENRLFPCLMTMRDVHGEVVRNEDGSLWTHPALASSSRGLPSYTRNGNTPAGVWTIDSVMPVADQQLSFGKFRRMMLNFIPKAKSELHIKALLPTSSHDQEWWKASIVARDAGRNLFRIHGTGRINKDSSTPYYPFMRTSGCIAQRENTYEGVTFKDQRQLLDYIMTAMDLKPSFENEVKVKGILYLIEIDSESASVLPQDLALRGIE